ncbi:MAG: DUF6492 family protein [Lachnospiraceae bacterium]
MNRNFETIIVITPQDFPRLQRHYKRLVDHLPCTKIHFVSSDAIADLLGNADLGDRADFISEDSLLPFSRVYEVMQDHLAEELHGEALPRGVVGWYYQQFLKMQYAYQCTDDYYMAWDGDTIPCQPIDMFQKNTGAPYLDLKREYHAPYFETLEKLLPGMKKCIERSFISEHMLFSREIMLALIAKIEENEALAGTSYWEKIIRAIAPKKIFESAFSEFETYGTFVAYTRPDAYKLREWHSFRLAGQFFEIDGIDEIDFAWLAKDFQAISFEKGHTVREDHRNLFNNPKYQNLLSARKMLETVQEVFKEGYIEVWEDSVTKNTSMVDPLAGSGSATGAASITGSNANTQTGLCRGTGSAAGATHKSQEEADLYENLGDEKQKSNCNQAFLCYENARFLSPDSMQQTRLRDKMQELQQNKDFRVKKTAICIVSYNCCDLMKECIASIREYCAPGSYCAVIVDNGSTDGVRDYLQSIAENAEDILLVLSEENLGFPKACNVCAQYAPADYDIFLLNNDTRMTHNALFWLRMGLYENDSVGATGCVANYCAWEQEEEPVLAEPHNPHSKPTLTGEPANEQPEKSALTDEPANEQQTKPAPLLLLPYEYQQYAAKVNVPMERPYEEKSRLCGFAMLIRGDVWDKTEGMDEEFTPGYMEDDDISYQIRNLGYELLICHNSYIYHAGSQSFRKREDLDQLIMRNYKYLQGKWKFRDGFSSFMYDSLDDALAHLPKDYSASFDVLMIGAGNGNFLTKIKYKYPNCNVIGCENDVASRHLAASTVPYYSYELKKEAGECQLPFASHSFDYIIVNRQDSTVFSNEEWKSILASYLKDNGVVLFVQSAGF